MLVSLMYGPLQVASWDGDDSIRVEKATHDVLGILYSLLSCVFCLFYLFIIFPSLCSTRVDIILLLR